jgi:uncharacterized protein
MTKLVVFGARGRAGRAAVTEATTRGHDVTALSREAADVTDPRAVADVAGGHDAAVVAVYDSRRDPAAFYPTVADALVEGLSQASVSRLVWVGLAPLLVDADGGAMRRRYPREHWPFIDAHGVVVRALAGSDLAWTAVSPSGDFDHDGLPVGRYRIAPGDPDSRITYADLARAVLDEIESAQARRAQIGVEAG